MLASASPGWFLLKDGFLEKVAGKYKESGAGAARLGEDCLSLDVAVRTGGQNYSEREGPLVSSGLPS